MSQGALERAAWECREIGPEWDAAWAAFKRAEGYEMARRGR